MARVLAVAADLMLGSRVEATLRAAGHEVTLSPSLQEAPLDGAELIVADLDVENPEALVAAGRAGARLLLARRRRDAKGAAEAAGVDLVVPRSRMARELPALAEGLLLARR